MKPELEGRALLVIHRLEASLGCYDVSTGAEMFRLPTAEYPHELCVGPAQRRLYVTEYGLRDVASAGEGGSTVAVFDLSTRERVDTLSTGAYRRPHGIAADAGGRLFVTCESERSLLIYRLEDASFLHVVDVGQETPHLVTVAPDGRTAVTSNMGSGTLSAVDVMMGEVLRHVTVLEGPEGLAFAPDGSRIYAANRKGSAVSIVDAVELRTIGRIDTGPGPTRLAVTPDGGRLAIALLDGHAVQVADTATRAVVQTIPVGRGAAGMTLSADGEVAFVSCEGESRVDVVSLEDGTVLTTIPTGEGPDALTCIDLALVE